MSKNRRKNHRKPKGGRWIFAGRAGREPSDWFQNRDPGTAAGFLYFIMGFRH